MTDLSIKIADAVVPDESDLAPLITEAFIRGGKEKEALFEKQESAGLGAFGLTESILLFPLILKGLVITAPLMRHFLLLDENYLDEVYHFLDMLDKRETKEKDNWLQEKDTKQLISLYKTFLSELKASGLTEEQCNEIIVNIFNVLRENPSDSLKFLEKVAVLK